MITRTPYIELPFAALSSTLISSPEATCALDRRRRSRYRPPPAATIIAGEITRLVVFPRRFHKQEAVLESLIPHPKQAKGRRSMDAIAAVVALVREIDIRKED